MNNYIQVIVICIYFQASYNIPLFISSMLYSIFYNWLQNHFWNQAVFCILRDFQFISDPSLKTNFDHIQIFVIHIFIKMESASKSLMNDIQISIYVLKFLFNSDEFFFFSIHCRFHHYSKRFNHSTYIMISTHSGLPVNNLQCII